MITLVNQIDNMKNLLITLIFTSIISYGQCNKETNVQFYNSTDIAFSTNKKVSVTFGKGSEVSNSYNYINFEQESLYCIINGFDKVYNVKLFTSYNSIYATSCSSIASVFNDEYVKGKDQDGRLWKIFKPKPTNVISRPERKYNPVTSSINHVLIAETLKEKQNAIDKERIYLESLSLEDRNALIRKKQYAQSKNYLYSKNLKRWYNTNKDKEKINKKFKKEKDRSTKEYYKHSKLKLSKITNGWHKTIVNIKVEGRSNFVYRLVYFKDGKILKYVGGTGFLADIKNQSKIDKELIAIKVGYEDSKLQTVYVSFIKNKTIKLNIDPMYPTLIKFYTTSVNGGKIFVYLNGENYSDYFTLEKALNKNKNITCEQTNGVVTFLVGKGDFEFYAHNDINQWVGNINTVNRYCIIKELESN